MTTDEAIFWPAFNWNANPWILDKRGNTLSRKKFDRIQSCTVEALHITRTTDTTYEFSIPVEGEAKYQQAKLRRWGLAILLSAPSIAVGAVLQVTNKLTLRHPPTLVKGFIWYILQDGRARGSRPPGTEAETTTITLEQMPNGITWIPVTSSPAETQPQEE
ncbi:uncharacterized protein PITG_08664 [Phytophthora infestans T30-4]|uniref:Uncharacterized protein n=1 Tax=Phytophthora infestans (strain T30-4) TaxID=403677 RepID=D0NCW3_PHYIT|nr:uncharacterized protein PITG_08664 [Phytophthora infestans T30-4]EEY55920.1 hypothetical protein PITG_08664 [Phytophthora infestans T30-4]|eukprot:XP_002902750.1 hypothetical protein PITG_08664 [Phytophthora infestans T30-4]